MYTHETAICTGILDNLRSLDREVTVIIKFDYFNVNTYSYEYLHSIIKQVSPRESRKTYAEICSNYKLFKENGTFRTHNTVTLTSAHYGILVLL
jgi:hypothetical protein